MDNIVYRKAKLEDLPTLLKFEQAIIEFERPFDSNLKDNCNYYNLNTLIQFNDAEVIVAQVENEIIACGYAKIVNAKQYHKNPKYAYLGFMYVKPAYRGQRIIQNIIELLKKWSESKNLFEARLEVYSNNSSAIKAYKNNGFKKHMVEMKMYL